MMARGRRFDADVRRKWRRRRKSSAGDLGGLREKRLCIKVKRIARDRSLRGRLMVAQMDG